MKLLPSLNLKAKIKESATGLMDVAQMIVQVAVPGGGSVICFAVGKVVVGLILAAITFAVAMRLVWRRKHADQTRSIQRLPKWAKLSCASGALVGSAVLVEMTKLPVRFDQPGFAMFNWLIVLLVILVLNAWFRGAVKSWINRPSAERSVTEK